jgi:hypothetical protein
VIAVARGWYPMINLTVALDPQFEKGHSHELCPFTSRSAI